MYILLLCYACTSMSHLGVLGLRPDQTACGTEYLVSYKVCNNWDWKFDSDDSDFQISSTEQ